ncbi:acyltransferase family protein [Brenneria populi]|uniref:acyltransferase family protein n=1 Tax=Brenneria populi TaxID=1505588 RepID=UPI0032ED36C7
MSNDLKNDLDTSWINTLKATCIILVVIYHVTQPGFENTISSLSVGRHIAQAWVVFNTHLSPFRMPAFFFVSGLLAYKNIMSRSWRELCTGKLANLLYLYILWCALQWISIQLIIHEITGERISQNSNAIYSSSLTSLGMLSLMGMSSSWYLYALLGYIILAKIGKKNPIIILFLALTLHYIAILKLVPFWGPQSLCRYFIFFYIGLHASSAIISFSQWKRGNVIPWSILFLGAIIHRTLGIPQNLCESLLAILIAIAICRWMNTYFSLQQFNKLSYITLPIYVIHRIIIELFCMIAIQQARLLQLFENDYFSYGWALGYPLIMTALCCIISLIIWKLINQGRGKWLFSITRRKNSVSINTS